MKKKSLSPSQDQRGFQNDYEKPVIIKVESPLVAKAGISYDNPQATVRPEIDGHTIKDLTKQFGSPLFVFSQKTMIKQYQTAYQAIAKHYPHLIFGWSYKTNYLRAVCQTFHQLGAYAEVVSDFEYDKAKNLGIPGSQIIFNGPYKDPESLKQAILDGALINVDHFGEIDDLEVIARNLDRVVTLGLRINCHTGLYPHWSRFGFNVENGQATNAVRRIIKSSHLELAGIHTHVGTFVLDHQAYRKAAEKVMELVLEIENQTKVPLRYIDLGGGFPSMNRLRGVYQSPEIAIPSIEKYAQSLTQPLKPLLERLNPPKLYMELGRHLIDEAGFLITSVVADKMLPDGRRSYTLDAGVNLLYTATWYKFNLETDQPVTGLMEPAVLHGPLCMNIDTIEEYTMLPRLSRGQHLVVSPVGAYNITQSMQFIRYRPAVVMVLDSGEVCVIKRKENLEDIEATECNLPLPLDKRERA